MRSRPRVIAIDGPAASGKGTLARRLAAHLGLPYLETGLLYRAVGAAVLAAQQAGDTRAAEAIAIEAARALQPQWLAQPGLDAEAVGEAASRISAVAQVRESLLQFQRDFAAQPGGAILDGRDIGTMIAPDAPHKFFVTATAEVRAQRRFAQLQARDPHLTYDAVLAGILARDARDAGREQAPMLAAADAVLLDTTQMNADAVFAVALAHLASANAGVP